jgi:hypothetical protein
MKDVLNALFGLLIAPKVYHSEEGISLVVVWKRSVFYQDLFQIEFGI